jgi:MipA family protein
MTRSGRLNRMARATFGNKGRSREQASVANDRQEPGEFGPVPVGEMLKTVLLTNDHSRGQALDNPIEAAVRARSARSALRRAKRPRLNHHDLLCAAFMALVLVPAGATADPLVTLPAPAFELPVLPPVSGTWTVMVGVGGEYKPDFEGANRSMLSPVPIFSIRRAGSAEQFRGPRDGASIALIDFGDLRAGPVGKFVAARKANNFAELNGLGDIGAAVELGGFLEYFPVDWFRTRVETRQGFGGHHGVVADFSADAIVPIVQGLTFSAGPRFTWESTKATAPYFGIDAAQAMATGLPVFNAKGGAHSVGAGAQLSYRVNPQWEVHSYVEYERLLGDAAASPLVTLRGSPNQTTIGIGASYAFDVKIR